MAIDPYSPCPGGTGKKVKFCCSDLVHELDKIQRMVSADQRQACLEYIEQLEQKFPDRACLMTTKAMLQGAAGKTGEAQETLDALLVKSPTNAVALAESALLAVERERDALAALPLLQQALASCPTTVPSHVVEATANIAQTLAASGEYVPARGYLLLLAGWMPDNRGILSMIMQMHAMTQAPLLFKEDPPADACPADAPWKAEFDAALEPARRGAWAVAAGKLTVLSTRAADSPVVWRHLANYRSWLADNKGAATAYRKVAALDVPLDDAVEAEATAQLLDPPEAAGKIDVVEATLAIADPARAVEAMLSDKRFLRGAVDPGSWEDEPPPQQAFVLLDRPMPQGGAGLGPDDLPITLGQALYFGRETNREARIELRIDRPDLESATTSLRESLGDALGAVEGEKVVGRTTAAERALRMDRQLPEDTPVEDMRRIQTALQRELLLQKWPETALPILGGKSPKAVSADPAMKIPLLAAILLIELGGANSERSALCNELREQLGLPRSGPIDPSGQAVDLLPLARLHRVEFDKLSDDELGAANRRAMFCAARLAMRKIAEEIVSRGTREGLFDRAQAYGALASLSDDSNEALDNIQKARESAVADKQSTAPWDLEELALRIGRREADQVMSLVRKIERDYRDEPQVRQALVQLLMETGLVRPDGSVPQPGGEAAAPIVMPGAETTESGKLWTPDSAGEAPSGKSKLWTPGMD